MDKTASAVSHACPFALTPRESEIFDLLRSVVEINRLGTVMRVAGGWVRDRLLGRESTDIDIALDDMMGLQFAEYVQARLAELGHETHSIGAIRANPDQSKHLETATMQVLGQWIDFVNLRSEAYADGSRIPTVAFGTPLQDALRRDLTINALFYNVNNGTIEDWTGHGLRDLAAGLVRTPLDPLATFLDDPLRVLRTVRFTARFGYAPVGGLVEVMASPAVADALAAKISRERVGKELTGSLTGPAPVEALAFLHRTGLDAVVFASPPGYDPVADEGNADADAAAAFVARARALHPLACAWLVRDVTRALAPTFELAGETALATLLAAALFPLAGLAVRAPGRAPRAVVLAGAIVRDGIKLRHKDGETVDILHRVALAFAPLLEADAAEVSRTMLGLLLRLGAAELWPAALSLAVALHAAPTGDALPQLEVHERWPCCAAMVAATRAGASALAIAARIDELGLHGVWALKPHVNGGDVQRVRGVRGPAVGAWLTRTIEFQLEHPDASRDDALAWLAAAPDSL